MSNVERVFSSEYMYWAKTKSHSRFNLATSGVANLPLSELPVKLEDLEISGASAYGYEPLQQALAAKSGVSPDCIVAATGTSMANHLAMAALLEPGDQILIETPGYELLASAARYLGAHVEFFDRRFEDGFAVDPDKVKRKITPRTRLIVVTNLHNPSSALIDEATLRALGEMARRAGAHVLVDEVYLDGAFDLASDLTRSAFHLGDEFIATNSLTKIYGLSGLRCGWIIAQPVLARRIWRLNDLFGAIPAHTAERLSVVALGALDNIRARSKAIVDTNREVLSRSLRSCDGLDVMIPDFGTVVFPRLRHGSVEELCDLLRNKYETTVVPGGFFGAPDHFRVGMGGETPLLEEGLTRLSSAVAELAQR